MKTSSKSLIIKEYTIKFIVALLLLNIITISSNSPLFLFETMGQYWSFYTIIALLCMLLSLIIGNKPYKTIYIVSLFSGMGLLTLLFAPLHLYPLGGILGTPHQANNGIILFASAPILFLTSEYLYSKNKAYLQCLFSLFVIIRLIYEYLYPLSINASNDFLSVALLLLLIILISSFDKKSIPLKELKKPTNILSIIAIALSLYSIYAFNNESVKLAMSFGAILAIVLVTIQHKFSALYKKLHKIIFLLPALISVSTTFIIYILQVIDTEILYNTSVTLWQRSTLLDMAVNAMGIKEWLIGNGWGLNNDLILNNVWVDGIVNYSNNKLDSNFNSSINGRGINHIHNSLFEFLMSGGILMGLGYLSIYVFAGWSCRNRPILLSMWTAFALTETVWFMSPATMVIYIFALGITIVSNDTTSLKPTGFILKLKKIVVTKSFILLALFSIFMSTTYIPYVNKLSKKIPSETFYGTYYAPEKTGFRTEYFIWRKLYLLVFNDLAQGKYFQQDAITYTVDIIDSLKKKSNEGYKKSTIELNNLYKVLFNIQTKSNTTLLEKFSPREFNNWATAVLRLAESYPKRYDLYVHYLSWHMDRQFYPAVDEMTKRLLRSDPNNPVALYWRGILFLEHDNPLGEDMIKDAFKLNVTRYQYVNPTYYKKYKSLQDPLYQ